MSIQPISLPKPTFREHVLLDVSRLFGVTASDADKMIKVNQGDRVMQGALVAESGGLFPRSLKAPRAGRVMVVGSGQVLMEVGDTAWNCAPGLPGLVTHVLPEHGVVIRTAGALIQGVWGNGRIDNGLMVNLMQKPDDVFTATNRCKSRGSVILGGQVRDLETLHAQPNAGARLDPLQPPFVAG